MCPGNHESAGKRRRVATAPGNQWLRRALVESARGRADQGQLLRPPPGPGQGAVAVARSLLDVIWHLLTTGEVFTDLGADYFASRQDKEHQAAA